MKIRSCQSRNLSILTLLYFSGFGIKTYPGRDLFFIFSINEPGDSVAVQLVVAYCSLIGYRVTITKEQR